MALVKKNTSANSAAAAASATSASFEDDNHTTVAGDSPFKDTDAGTSTTKTRQVEEVKGAEDVKKAEPEHAEATASVAATTTIAKAAATSTAVARAGAADEAKKFQREVEAMRGASDFSYGNYRVFKGDNGEIVELSGDKEKLGRWAKVRMISWDDHFEVSPGEQGASTKDFVAYSKDGKTIDSIIGEELKSWVGRTVEDYVQFLRVEEEFANTKCRRFVDIGCALMATESGEGPIGTVIQVTLAESSIPAFSKYQQSLQDNARCVAMGLPGFTVPEDPFTFFFIREAASKGNKSWTKLKLAKDLPAKI